MTSLMLNFDAVRLIRSLVYNFTSHGLLRLSEYALLQRPVAKPPTSTLSTNLYLSAVLSEISMAYFREDLTSRQTHDDFIYKSISVSYAIRDKQNLLPGSFDCSPPQIKTTVQFSSNHENGKY